MRILLILLTFFPHPVFTQNMPGVPNLSFLPADFFLLGDSTGDADEHPVHRVQISGFYKRASCVVAP